jgi:hypothetical protein
MSVLGLLDFAGRSLRDLSQWLKVRIGLVTFFASLNKWYI